MTTNKSKLLTVMKILFLIIYLSVTVWLVFGLLDILITPSGDVKVEIALYLTFIIIIFGTLGYSASLIFAIIGFIFTLVKKQGKGNVIFFTIALILPILTQTALIVTCQLIA